MKKRDIYNYSALQFSVLALLAAGIYLFSTSLGYAGTTIGSVLCTQVVQNEIRGRVGQGIATIGVAMIGIMALVGRVTWGQAILVGVGVAVIFGSAGIANMLGGGC